MMRLFLIAFSFTCAVACVPNAATSTIGGNDTRGLVAATDDIIGIYVVTQVNGAAPVINIEGHEPIVTIGATRIHFQSQCIYADWTYERSGSAISTERYYEPGSAMCARALAPGETAIQNSLDKAVALRQTRDGVYLEGGGYRLDLHLRGRALRGW